MKHVHKNIYLTENARVASCNLSFVITTTRDFTRCRLYVLTEPPVHPWWYQGRAHIAEADASKGESINKLKDIIDLLCGWLGAAEEFPTVVYGERVWH